MLNCYTLPDMNKDDTRRINARILAAARGGQAAFAREMGMDAAQVSQLIGKNPKRNIGRIIKRRIEERYDLDKDVLDKPINAQEVTADEAEILVMYRELTPEYSALIYDQMRLYLDRLGRLRNAAQNPQPSDGEILRATDMHGNLVTGVANEPQQPGTVHNLKSEAGEKHGTASEVRLERDRKNTTTKPQIRRKKNESTQAKSKPSLGRRVRST